MLLSKALESFENWWQKCSTEDKSQMLERFGINAVPDNAEDVDFTTQTEIGAALIAQKGNLKIYFRYPHSDKNIMAWATGNSLAVEAFDFVVTNDWIKAKNTSHVAGHIWHQVQSEQNKSETASGWEYWVAKTSEKTNEVEEHILSLCKRLGVEMDLML